LPGTIALARSFRAQAVGDVAGAADQARRALNLLPEDDHVWRGGAASSWPWRLGERRQQGCVQRTEPSDRVPHQMDRRADCVYDGSHVLEIALDLIVTPVRIALATATPATATW
jgi:hypothetical protein